MITFCYQTIQGLIFFWKNEKINKRRKRGGRKKVSGKGAFFRDRRELNHGALFYNQTLNSDGIKMDHKLHDSITKMSCPCYNLFLQLFLFKSGDNMFCLSSPLLGFYHLNLLTIVQIYEYSIFWVHMITW